MSTVEIPRRPLGRRLADRLRESSELTAFVLLSIMFFGFSLHIALATPPLWNADERPHAAYALDLLSGSLPTIDTPVTFDPQRYPQIAASLEGVDLLDVDGAGPQRLDIWTANHPPLYYVVSAPFVGIADAIGEPGAGLLAMRMINAMGMALTIVLIGLLARELVPSRPAVPRLAAVVATSCSTVAYIGGFIFNDGPALAASTLTLLLGVRMLRHGPTRKLLWQAAIAGTAAASFRVPGVVAVATCAAMTAVAVAVHERTPDRRRKAIRAGIFVGGLPALVIGWFYLRNLVLYGDVTATDALLGKFERETVGTVTDVATDGDLYLKQIEGLWVRGGTNLAWLPYLVVAAALVGVGLAGRRWLRRRRAASAETRAMPRVVPVTVLAWGFLVFYAAVQEVSFINFRSGGGNPHIRYTFPMFPLIAIVVAAGLLALASAIRTTNPVRRDALFTAGVGTFLLGFAFVSLHVSTVIVENSHKSPGLEAPTIGGIAPYLPLVLSALAGIAFLANQLKVAREAAASPPVPEHQPATAAPAAG